MSILLWPRRLLTLTVAAGLAATLLGGCSSQRALPLISGTGAVYPPEARANGVEGFVVVRYDVDAGGEVTNLRVVRAQPQGVFEQSALQAVSRWRFQPPSRNGEPVAVKGLQSRLEFSMGGGEAYADY